MADATGIEWCDATWNCVRGCSMVSAGCTNCYAMRVASRFSGKGLPYEGLTRDGKWNGKVRLVPEVLDQPLRWKRPRRIFVNSMSDLFHESLTNEQIAAVFGVMAAAPQHTFQVLTKRPARMAEWFAWAEPIRRLHDAKPSPVPVFFGWAMESMGSTVAYVPTSPWPLPNVWVGVSVENQAAADERIPLLLQTPAAVRFLSCEPLLGPVDLQSLPANLPPFKGDYFDALDGRTHDPQTEEKGMHPTYPRIDWIICGGESGPGARPMHPAWARSLRDQCAAANVPFFMKQMSGVLKPKMPPIPADLLIREFPHGHARDPEKLKAAKRRYLERKKIEKYGAEAAGKNMRGRHGNHSRGSEHHRWNDGRIVASTGYVKVRVGIGHPLADPNGYAYEHLVVWAAAGRRLPGDEEVIHHLNENKQDNRLENLALTTRVEHSQHHIDERARDQSGRLLDGVEHQAFPEVTNA